MSTLAEGDLKYYPNHTIRKDSLLLIGGLMGGLLMIGAISVGLYFLVNNLNKNENDEVGSYTAKIVMMGDVMIGRRIDKLFDPHNTDPNDQEDEADEATMEKFRDKTFNGSSAPYSYIWGNMLSYLSEATLRIINLETSVTTYNTPWPNKPFNFRMHPANIQTLVAANISYCSIANNHILDYKLPGMIETLETLDNVSIPYGGAGRNLSQASKPVILDLQGVKVGVFSWADGRQEWAATETREGVQYVNADDNVTDSFFTEYSEVIKNYKLQQGIDIVIFSIHWGPNWQWSPEARFPWVAHNLIDRCYVDIVFGHSSHHIQGVEVYHGKPIIYGAGDFIDDYGSSDEFRNDLSFLYGVNVDVSTKRLVNMELIPTQISKYQVNKAKGNNLQWLKDKLTLLNEPYQTKFTVNDDNRFIFDLKQQ